MVRCSKVIICSFTFATARYPLLLFHWKEEGKENYVNLFILDFFWSICKTKSNYDIWTNRSNWVNWAALAKSPSSRALSIFNMRTKRSWVRALRWIMSLVSSCISSHSVSIALIFSRTWYRPSLMLFCSLLISSFNRLHFAFKNCFVAFLF